MSFNEADARAFYRWLEHGKEEFTEIRIIPWPSTGAVIQRWVQSEDEFAKVCKNYSGKDQVYVGVNPRTRESGSAKDISRVVAVPFDVDAKRLHDKAATEEELAAAKKRMIEIVSWMRIEGFQQPFISMSGNGFHIIQKVDLPINESLAGKLEAYFHKAVPEGDLDSIFDLPRIIKVPGTLSVKGIPTKDRPHRLSYILNAGNKNIDNNLNQYIQKLEPYTGVVNNHSTPTTAVQKITKTRTGNLKPCFKRFAEEGCVLSQNRSEDHLLRLALVTEAHFKKYTKEQIIDLFRKADDFNLKITTDKVNRQLGEIAVKGIKVWSCSAIYKHNGCIGESCHIFRKFMKQKRNDELLTPEIMREMAQDATQKRKSQAKMLVELALNRETEFFYDQHEIPFARIKQKNCFAIFPLRSRKFKIWLADLMWKDTEDVPANKTLKNAINVLEAHANENIRYTLYNRVAPAEDGIWLDMTDDKWRAIKVTAEGWTIVENPPILFKRYNHQLPIPEPVKGGDHRKFFDFVNIYNDEDPEKMEEDKETELMITAMIITNFIPDIPHVIPHPYGFPGSTKSFLFKIWRSLVDPSTTELLSIPRDINTLMQNLSHNWCAFFDNVSYLPLWVSDALCRASTGVGHQKRQLWTDDEDININVKNCVGIEGVNVVASQSDLLQRTILLGLREVEEEQRKEEKVFRAEFEQQKPEILGGYLDLLSKTLKEYPTVNPKKLFRMADFTRYGCAVAKALNKTEDDFITAYENKNKKQVEESVLSSPVGSVIMNYVEDMDEWYDSPTQLLADLTKHAKGMTVSTRQKIWPKSPAGLTGKLNYLIPNMKKLGVEVIKDLRDPITNKRRIRIINHNFKILTASQKIEEIRKWVLTKKDSDGYISRADLNKKISEYGFVVNTIIERFKEDGLIAEGGKNAPIGSWVVMKP